MVGLAGVFHGETDFDGDLPMMHLALGDIAARFPLELVPAAPPLSLPAVMPPPSGAPAVPGVAPPLSEPPNGKDSTCLSPSASPEHASSSKPANNSEGWLTVMCEAHEVMGSPGCETSRIDEEVWQRHLVTTRQFLQ